MVRDCNAEMERSARFRGRERADFPHRIFIVPARSTLTFRLGLRSDLPGCRTILAPGDPCAAFGDGIVGLWERCLGRGGFTVIEDPTMARPASLQAFGMSVFVRDAFAEAYFASPKPGIGGEIVSALLRGEHPLLSDEEIAAANSGDGLNVVVLHFGARYTDYGDPRTLPIVGLIGPSFFFVHSGYRIRTILAETYGAESTRFSQQGPFNLLRDFADENPSAYARIPLGHRPNLVGLRRDWVHGARFFPLSQLFFTEHPRIWFTQTERRVLERAVMNESDDAIAESLGISTHTVKKAWNTALARAIDALPGIIPNAETPSGVRGPEKRRFLLDYLRLHMEEVRPYRKAQ